MRRRVLAALASALLAAPGAAQVPRPLPFGEGWELSTEGARVERHRGVQALRMRTGGAVRRDVVLEDGTIEFDLLMAPHRAFVYLRFRLASDGEGEEIYFRPHKSSLPDAIQYTSVWRGGGNWQLYHGDWGTAPAPAGEPVAAVANVVVRPGHVPYRFEPEAPPELPAGLVRRWQLSPAFPADTAPASGGSSSDSAIT